jgi:hypothetical protein
MTLAAADRRLANATVTLEGPVKSNGFVNGHAMLHHRWFPRIELDGVDALDEVVTMSGVESRPRTGVGRTRDTRALRLAQ